MRLSTCLFKRAAVTRPLLHLSSNFYLSAMSVERRLRPQEFTTSSQYRRQEASTGSIDRKYRPEPVTAIRSKQGATRNATRSSDKRQRQEATTRSNDKKQRQEAATRGSDKKQQQEATTRTSDTKYYKKH
ncbi:hypothetical protein O988_03315 [Pseudogymnoascus sp. VKM F-3808]|nr:hypothetical protein O988_03315 [Pseudogymnoascus sp. VKM F-3808]